jgi:hypothetical protein
VLERELGGGAMSRVFVAKGHADPELQPYVTEAREGLGGRVTAIRRVPE